MAVGVIIVRGPGRGQTFTLGTEAVVIGRETGAAKLVIADAGVSRRHARISQVAGLYAIEDLGSTNGTFVNGERVTGSAPLVSGDLIELGTGVTLSFEDLDSANVTMLALNQGRVGELVDDIVQQEYFQKLKERMKDMRRKAEGPEKQ
jgi:pSer/pThr/pTyr-binding forkhead associated (FHA) protein